MEVLNGTKKGAFACVTRPKPVRIMGFPKLIPNQPFFIPNIKRINVQLANSSLLFDPVYSVLNGIVESWQIWIFWAICILIREQLEGAKPNLRNVDDILAIHTL